ncbi:MAG TPA: hypothetical protein VFJ91_13270 [Gaiellaceae bacterium]|nr:hypothetical protein [Gaiellaceae bacterium]
MRRLCLLAALTAIALAAAAAASAAEPPPLPKRATLVAQRSSFRTFAVKGLAQTRKAFWLPDKGWYATQAVAGSPVATTWYVFPFLELAAAVAIDKPTAANKAFVNQTFLQAEKYWDPTLSLAGGGGVSWSFALQFTGTAYFDDAGWWGAAYLDAYRATGKKRWLWDAGRALAWIDSKGWDWTAGGMWWDTSHRKKTSEPLAAGAMIAATLYNLLHRQYYLAIAKRYITYADRFTRNPRQGNLYGRSATDGTVMDYVEGMMIDAHVQLCQATKQKSWCRKAEALADAALDEFPIMASWAPETDVVYERALLDLYAQDGNPRWYAVAYANGAQAKTHARNIDGLWDLHWDGTWMTPKTLYGQSATLQLFAWLAAADPPR